MEKMCIACKRSNVHTRKHNCFPTITLAQSNIIEKFHVVKTSDTKTGVLIKVFDGVCSVSACQYGSKDTVIRQ